MACSYTGTLSTVEDGFLIKDTGEIVVQFFTEDIDTSDQLPLTVPFLFDTDKTQAEIQADIDTATLPGNVITLVSIDGTGSVFSFSITRPCPAANLQSLLLAEEQSETGALTSSCSCSTVNKCVFTGELSFPEITPGTGTFFITINGITTQITFDTNEQEDMQEALVYASVIDKNNNNVFIVSFDGNGLVLGFEIIRPCPETSLTVTATVLAAGEFDILPQDPIEIQFTDEPSGNSFTQCQLLDTALVVGQTYIVKVDVSVGEGAITLQVTYGTSLDSGVIPIAAPFSSILEFPFVVQPGDENAQLCVDVDTVGDNNTANIDNVAVAEAVETEVSTEAEVVCDCQSPKKKKRALGYLPPMLCVAANKDETCYEYMRFGGAIYVLTGRDRNGKCCYQLYRRLKNNR